jgi:hypothetical protein
MIEVLVNRSEKHVEVRTIYNVTMLSNGLQSFEESVEKYPNTTLLNIAEGYVVVDKNHPEKLNFDSDSVLTILPKALSKIIFK